MRPFAVTVLLLVACTKKQEAPPALMPAPAANRPQVVKVEGAIHAVKCGEVTAVFRGEAPEQGIPVAFGVESVGFRFGADELPFKPMGEVAGPHRTLDVFSPDCQYVLLQHDSSGPFKVLPVPSLEAHLRGKDTKLWDVRSTNDGGTAQIHHDPVWREDGTLEFQASCCGGVEVFASKEGRTERIAFFASAPSGVKREVDGGYALPHP